MNILDRILTKRGIKSVDDLDSDERQTFAEWQAVLSKDTLTVDDITTFCRQQIGVIEAKWQDLNLDQKKKSELIPYYTVYRIFEKIITSPQQARENLEKHLEQLIT